MRTWKLAAADPYMLRLAADARHGPTDYVNDHIWEITLGGGAPPAIGVRTTYGLRAQNMRLYPGFAEGDRSAVEPAQFTTPPTIQAFSVSYARLALETQIG